MVTSIGRELKRLRKYHGFTLRQVEEKCEVSNAYLSQLETGNIKNPSGKVLLKLSRMYGVSMDDLCKHL